MATMQRSSLFVCSALVVAASCSLAPPAGSGGEAGGGPDGDQPVEAPESAPERPRRALRCEEYWELAQEHLEAMLARSGQTLADIEQPGWYAIPYNTLGRMHLIDRALERPFNLPHLASSFGRRALNSTGRGLELFAVADEAANSLRGGPWFDAACVDMSKDIEALPAPLKKIEALPERVATQCAELFAALTRAAKLRDQAFAALDADQMKRLRRGLTGFHLVEEKGKRVFRAHTPQKMDDALETLTLAQKVDYEPLLTAAALLCGAMDRTSACFHAHGDVLKAAGKGMLLEYDAPFGRIGIGGSGDDTYTRDYALLIDCGGNDTYRNNAGAAGPDSHGIGLLIDVGGNDTYEGGDCVQGTGLCGIGALIDMGGNDTYRAANYAQAAALCGFGFLMDAAGNDRYTASLGAQSFALCGYGILADRAGDDRYTLGTMGLGFGSTLGVGLCVDVQGNDSYTSGGVDGFDFYQNNDSSCALGSACGMRLWPPNTTTTLYGGIGIMSEGEGNDTYRGYSFVNGAAYMFALGMMYEGAGDDTYTGANYAHGAGCHCAAGVLVDSAGNDLYFAEERSIGFSLDRSCGVLFDTGGDDIYSASIGCGGAGKPKGCGILADMDGDDRYRGSQNVGWARHPYSVHVPSTAFFLDLNGSDRYPGAYGTNDKEWRQQEFGYARDATQVIEDDSYKGKPSPPRVAEMPLWRRLAMMAESGEDASLINRLCSPSALARFAALDDLLASPKRYELMARIACGAPDYSHDTLIDAADLLFVRGELAEDDRFALCALLGSPDWRMRVLPLRCCSRLGCGKDPRVLDALLAHLPCERDARAAGLCALALGRSMDVRALPALEARSKDASPYVRVCIGMGLEGFKGNAAALDALKKCVPVEQDRRVLAACAHALGALEMADAVDVLAILLREASPYVRLEAALALATTYKDDRGTGELIELLSWDNPIVRGERVGPALREITGQSFKTQAEWRTWHGEQKAVR